jgi:hypothetical protein
MILTTPETLWLTSRNAFDERAIDKLNLMIRAVVIGDQSLGYDVD